MCFIISMLCWKSACTTNLPFVYLQTHYVIGLEFRPADGNILAPRLLIFWTFWTHYNWLAKMVQELARPGQW